MKNLTEIFKLLSDENRLRMVLVLDKKELCVCQLMGILAISQPLVSRNLSLLAKGGFLEDRREGKLIFYRISRNLSIENGKMLKVIKELVKDNETVRKDQALLVECTEFQKVTGKCDMETFRKFVEGRNKKHKSQPRENPAE